MKLKKLEKSYYAMFRVNISDLEKSLLDLLQLWISNKIEKKVDFENLYNQRFN